MPELPDVETFRRYLDATALHQQVEQAEVREPGMVKQGTARELEERLAGAVLTGTRRHGKYCFASLDRGDDRSRQGGWLVLHFGMTGFLAYYKDPDSAPDHVRLQLDFANGYHLALDSQRKLGRTAWTQSVEAFVDDQDLGPDALSGEFTLERFLEAADGRRGTLKGLLMNQEAMAGIGNVYSDEILFQAGIHPKAGVKDLGPGDLEEVYHKLRLVLEKAVEAGADPAKLPQGFLTRHRHRDGECPGSCPGELRRIEVVGRGARYCPACQTKGAPS